MTALLMPQPLGLTGVQPVSFGSGLFGGPAFHGVLPLGLSIAQIADLVPGLPTPFERYGTACLDGEPIERFELRDACVIDRWQRIRPKPRADGTARVTFHLGLHGKGARSLLSIVASIALVAVGTFITGGGLALAGGLFAAGSTSATLLAAAVGILGRFALTALAPPAARDKKAGQAAELGNAGADGNVLQPGGAIPRCCGEVKIFPPMASLPLIDLAGNDEWLEAAYVLAGPHQLRDLRIENAAADEVDGLQYVLDEGLTQAPAALLERHGNQKQVQVELKAHQRDDDHPERLKHQDNPGADLPSWRTDVTGLDPDEIWLHLIWPQGMGKQSGTVKVGLPLRLRMRPIGTEDWINLPELWFYNKKIGAIRKGIKLKWGNVTTSDPPVLYGAWQAFHTVPAATYGIGGGGAWAAHSSFQASATINDVARIGRTDEGFTVWLDEAVFPRGLVWEVQIKRGCLVPVSDFTVTTYTYPGVGNISSFFDYFNSGSAGAFSMVPASNFYDETIVETLTLTRFASVWNRPPLPLAGDARIELRAKNVQASQVSVLASGYVPKWNGTEWAQLDVSDNPADHYRDVLGGLMTHEPVEAASIDEAGLLAWAAECVTRGYKIAAAFDGRSWRDTLSAIAACGKARRKEGSRWGVAYERDWTGLNGRQTITPRNANNVRMLKGFDPAPDALRVSYRDRNRDWADTERMVVRPGLALEEVREIGAVTAIGLTTAAEIDMHFQFDLKAADLRDHVLEADVHVDHLVSEVGDMVSVSHVLLSRHMATARIAALEKDGGGLITAIRLDARKDLATSPAIEGVPLIEGVAEMADLGQALAATVALPDAVITVAITPASASTTRLVLLTPLDEPAMRTGHLVMIGPAETPVGRYLIKEISPARRFNARLTLIPDVPELYA